MEKKMTKKDKKFLELMDIAANVFIEEDKKLLKELAKH